MIVLNILIYLTDELLYIQVVIEHTIVCYL